jgi:hypothetical protein
VLKIAAFVLGLASLALTLAHVWEAYGPLGLVGAIAVAPLTILVGPFVVGATTAEWLPALLVVGAVAAVLGVAWLARDAPATPR